jgi:hypothetical protein
VEFTAVSDHRLSQEQLSGKLLDRLMNMVHRFCLLLQKKSTKIPVGPVMLGFFLFVVVGSGKLGLPRHAV